MAKTDKITSRQVQFIQAQRRQLGISVDVYCEMKRSVGVQSTLDLTGYQFEELLKRMNGSILRKSARTRMDCVGGKPDGEIRTSWKPLHSSAAKSGMHHAPAPDREDMVRKIEAILTEMKLPWSYVDGMAKRMFGLEAFRFCDGERTYKLLQALCVYQKRMQDKKNASSPKVQVGDLKFYVKELKGDQCQCGRSKGSGKSFCYTCWKLLTPELQKSLYWRIGEGYEEAYEAAVIHLDKVRHQHE